MTRELGQYLKLMEAGKLAADMYSHVAEHLAPYTHLSTSAATSLLNSQGGIPDRGPGSHSLKKAARRVVFESAPRNLK